MKKMASGIWFLLAVFYIGEADDYPPPEPHSL